MRVRAIKTGYFNGLHIPETDSEEFDVPNGCKGSWFVPVKKAQQPKQDTEQGQSAEPSSGDGSDSLV